jgi:hypothetical protein
MRDGRILTTLLLALGVAACGAAVGEKVSFSPVGPPDRPGAVVPAAVPGTLSFPPNPAGRVPAVVIAHDSAGLIPEGPEPDYVAALNAAGMATLVIDMWTPRHVPSGPSALAGDGVGDRRPRAIGDTLPDAFGALTFLAAHPGVDPRRIGIMGFSWGAMLSVLAMSEPVAERALGLQPAFRGAFGALFRLLWLPSRSPHGVGDGRTVDRRAVAAAGRWTRRLRQRRRRRFLSPAGGRFAAGQAAAGRAHRVSAGDPCLGAEAAAPDQLR